MKIYFSPYFNGHTYLDYKSHSGGLMGEVIESSEGLLSRLELMCGMSYPDETDDFKDNRVAEYYDALIDGKNKGNALYPSVCNDSKDEKRFNVTTELLRWRDVLILAGWDMKDGLPGKLSIIRDTEPLVKGNGDVKRGSADRWFRLKEKAGGLKGKVTIDVRCPKVIVEPLIRDVIEQVDEDIKYLDKSATTLNDCDVLQFNEQYEAYEWLALQPVTDKQVVVCNDGQRLDNVLNCFGMPVTSGDAKMGCHHVISDVRSFIDAPESLTWIDCNGDYGFRYPYDFLSEDEKGKLTFPIPSEQKMLNAVHNHIVYQLNLVKDVTLVCAKYDTAKLLTQHPMVASVLFKNGKEKKIAVTTPNVKMKRAADPEIHFNPEPFYDVKVDVNVNTPVMSYSALEQLIQLPFNFVVERELGLYEPYDKQDVRTEKGNVAHRVVRFLYHDYGSKDLNVNDNVFEKYLDEACTLMDDHTTKYHSILLDDENKFELEDLAFNLCESLKTLSKIIMGNDLTIVGSEEEIPADAKASKSSVNLPVFGESKAFIDLILKKKDAEEYYIFDFKYSMSMSHPDKLEENKSIQFAFYKEIFEKHYQGGGKKLTGIGYYLFPLQTLFVPDNLSGGLKGNNVKEVKVDKTIVNDTLKSMEASFDYRMKEQLSKGYIEEGEGMDIDSAYSGITSIFPINCKGKKGIKDGPYTQNHIVLKNQIR